MPLFARTNNNAARVSSLLLVLLAGFFGGAARAGLIDLAPTLEWKRTKLWVDQGASSLTVVSVVQHPDFGAFSVSPLGEVHFISPVTFEAHPVPSTGSEGLCYGGPMAVSALGRLYVYGGAITHSCGGTTGGDGGGGREGRRGGQSSPSGSQTTRFIWEGSVTAAADGSPAGVSWRAIDLGVHTELGSIRGEPSIIVFGDSLFVFGGGSNSGSLVVEISLPTADGQDPAFVVGADGGGLIDSEIIAPALFPYNGEIWIFGGAVGNADVDETLYSYDTTARTFTNRGKAGPGSSFPTRRRFNGAWLYEDSDTVLLMENFFNIWQLDLVAFEWHFRGVTRSTNFFPPSQALVSKYAFLADTDAARSTSPRIVYINQGEEILELNPTACPPGSDPASPADFSCYGCPLNTVASQDPSTGEWICIDCPGGQATSTIGAAECSPCEAGTFIQEPSAFIQDKFEIFSPTRSGCQNCTAGTYSDAGAAACTSCPTGFISANGGASECKPCPPGQTSGQVMTTAEFVDLTQCVPCFENTYKPAVSTLELGLCNGCPVFATSPAGSTSPTDCVCPEGQAPFIVEFPPPKCGNCPNNADCDVAFQGEGVPPIILPHEGYWNSADSPQVVLPCPMPAGCPGGAVDNCATGYEGIACATCDDQHFQIGQECELCPDAPEGLMVLVALIAFLIAYALYKTGGTEPLTSLGISLAHFQAISLFASLDLSWPTSFTDMWRSISFFNFNVDAASPECSFKLTYYDKVVVAFFIPYFFLGLFALVYATVPRYLASSGKADKAERMKEKLARASLQFLDIFYLAYLGRMMRYFVCDDVTFLSLAGDDLTETTFSRLLDDPSIDCDSSKYENYSAVPALGIVIIGLGVPVLFYTLLRKSQTDKNWEAGKGVVGFLRKQYANRFWYWPLVVLGRKLMLSIFQAFEAVADATTSAGLSLGVLVVALTFHILRKPYKETLANRQETVLMSGQILALLLGVGFAAEDEVDSNDVLEIAAAIVIGTSMIVAVVFVAIEAYRVFSQRLQAIVPGQASATAPPSGGNAVPMQNRSSAASQAPRASSNNNARNNTSNNNNRNSRNTRNTRNARNNNNRNARNARNNRRNRA